MELLSTVQSVGYLDTWILDARRLARRCVIVDGSIRFQYFGEFGGREVEHRRHSVKAMYVSSKLAAD
jgi:hypothetical protein